MGKRSNLDRIADELRAISLALDEGEFIGSEDSLTKRFEVSGPTLRKAVCVLEHEEVIEVRRGIRGGFFAHRPNMATASRMAGIYLSAHPESMDEVTALSEALAPILIDSVLKSRRLAEFARFAPQRTYLVDYDAFVQELQEFALLIRELSNNRSLQLTMSIFQQVGLAVFQGRDPTNSSDQLRYQKAQSDLAGALVGRDREAAIRAYVELGRIFYEGIKANLLRQRQRNLPARKAG